MLFLGLFFVAVLAWVFYMCWDCGETLSAIFLAPMIAILATLVAGIFWGPISQIPANSGAELAYKYESTNLIALQDNIGYNVYRYYVRSDGDNYTYLYETDEGITSATIPAKRSYLNYTDEVPYITTKTCTGYKNKILNLIFIPSICTKDVYYVYIPEGTITAGYNIDLK